MMTVASVMRLSTVLIERWGAELVLLLFGVDVSHRRIHTVCGDRYRLVQSWGIKRQRYAAQGALKAVSLVLGGPIAADR